MLNLFTRLFKDEEGQGMAEYALILVLVAIGVIAVLAAFRQQIVATFQKIAKTLRDSDTVNPDPLS